MTPTELEELVKKMRELGVDEYTDGTIRIKLGSAPISVDEKSEKEQQRIRDEREVKMLEQQRRRMLAATSYFGPPLGKIR